MNGINESLCLYRDKEFSLLKVLLGDSILPKSIFIYGNSATGKTLVTKKVIQSSGLQYSSVSCTECFNSKLIYQKILSDAGHSSEKSCSTMMDFCRYLAQCTFALLGQPFCIILDKAERLRKMDCNLLPSFLRLGELTKLDISVLFISELIYEKFVTSSGFYEPIKIHFKNYAKDQLKDIMTYDCPDDFSTDFYKGYVTAIVDVFFHITNNLTELRHLATVNFSKYCEPIVEGEIDKNDYRRLWAKIMPHLKKALQTVYLREVSSVQWETMQEKSNYDKTIKAQVELPYYSKHLLLAAFFASYNPANSDRRFFAKRCVGKMSSRAKRSVKSIKNSDKKFLGPKPFQLDRLMAIFYSIAGEAVSPSANILSQISTLVTLKLLVKCSSDDQIDVPKYKCIVPLELAIAVGKQVEVDVLQYLYDT
uniref:Origin recognition complex subunit 5 n=1 Tax=Hydra vulgaris TaxID=6087 RepID=T2MJ17_HYDVU